MPVKLIIPSRWYRLIPLVFITYSLAYLDRANFGFAAAGEMARDLGITSATSDLYWVLCFFWAISFFRFREPGSPVKGAPENSSSGPYYAGDSWQWQPAW